MIEINGKKVVAGKFPDGTLLLKEKIPDICGTNPVTEELRQAKNRKADILQKTETGRTRILSKTERANGLGKTETGRAEILWKFESNEELVTLIYLTRHLQTHGISEVHLNMPYIPNARQDRVKSDEDVFTLKYFAEVINALNYKSVTVFDPHSYVSEALINNIIIKSPRDYILQVLKRINDNRLLLFYPDEGAMKRYAGMLEMPYVFGIKKRDWKTGKITELDVAGETNLIGESNVLIVDDICSRGGTFLFSSKKLKELGAKDIYLYVSHCENTIMSGELLAGGLIKKVFTTDSIFTENDERIEVIRYE